jgi:cob(I)yrinic acid a,c-diamide adenosyltransferase (EC 2.5.1.17)
MIQFIKGSWHYGEMDSSKRLEPEFEMVAIGKGFVGIIDDKSPKSGSSRNCKRSNENQ